MAKGDIKYTVPVDDIDDVSPEITLIMDAESDLTIQQDTSLLMLTLPQAYATHQALGQLLMKHQRSWGPAKAPVLTLVPASALPAIEFRKLPA